jgi:hypothetical protein
VLNAESVAVLVEFHQQDRPAVAVTRFIYEENERPAERAGCGAVAPIRWIAEQERAP